MVIIVFVEWCAIITMKMHRFQEAEVVDRLANMPAVVLLGPRQVGKTTLALDIAGNDGVYLDLESPSDRAKLDDAELFLSSVKDKLVILDEVQRVPELFQILRGVIDKSRRKGKRFGRFLLLGSASNDLLQQSETLAGRIAYVELCPFSVMEAKNQNNKLWVRGGFPDSFLARDDRNSMLWRQDFIRTYLERDIPLLGPRIPPVTLRRFWTMLAHVQSGMGNAAELARGLMVDGKTIARYTDLMVDLMLVRRLQPFHVNVGKRLVKSPKLYVRDSGLLHALLQIEDHQALLGHPVVGASWEGFVLENLLRSAPPQAVPFFYRTVVGAEIDLLLDIPGHGCWAIEIKFGLSSRPEKGFHIACEDLKPTRKFVVNSGQDRYPISPGLEVIGLDAMCAMLAGLEFKGGASGSRKGRKRVRTMNL